VTPAQTFFRQALVDYATCRLQELELGEFAKPDFKGSSIRLLHDRVNSLPSMVGLTLEGAEISLGPIPQHLNLDLKSEAQRLIREVQTEGYTLDYDYFKP